MTGSSVDDQSGCFGDFNKVIFPWLPCRNDQVPLPTTVELLFACLFVSLFVYFCFALFMVM